MKPTKRNLKRIISIIILIIIIITNIFMGKLIKNKKINLEPLAKDKMPIIEKKKLKKPQKEINKIPDNYLGYLIIPKQNFKKLIKLGTEDNVLNQNIVGLYKNGNHLDSKKGQIILAGHNNKDVFKNLPKLKIYDEIKIITKEKTYTYKITKKKIISIDDYSNFNTYKNEKEIVLITCISKTTRLLVFAK